MAKPPKQRDNYMGEIATISRVARTVAADQRRDPDWRRKVVNHLYDAVKLLMQDSQDNISPAVPPTPRLVRRSNG